MIFLLTTGSLCTTGAVIIHLQPPLIDDDNK